MQQQNFPTSLTIERTRKILQVSNGTIFKIISAGKLRTYKVGRRRFCTPEAITDFQRECEDVVKRSESDTALA